MLRFLNKKAQSTAEYVIVLGLIIGAVVAMQTYVKRGFQAKIHDASVYRDPDEGNRFLLRQYEPYYLSSDFDTERNTDENVIYQTAGSVNRVLNEEFTNRTGNQTIGTEQQE